MSLEVLSALGDLSLVFIVPAVLFLLKIVWGIKTNDLPHIYAELKKMNGNVKK